MKLKVTTVGRADETKYVLATDIRGNIGVMSPNPEYKHGEPRWTIWLTTDEYFRTYLDLRDQKQLAQLPPEHFEMLFPKWTHTLTWNVSVQELRRAGYHMQKYFAANYICYQKSKVKYGLTLRCWKAGKEIELNEYGWLSRAVLIFLFDSPPMKPADPHGFMGEPYIRVSVNTKTGHVAPAKSFNRDFNEDDKAWSKYQHEHSFTTFLQSDIEWLRAELNRVGANI